MASDRTNGYHHTTAATISLAGMLTYSAWLTSIVFCSAMRSDLC